MGTVKPVYSDHLWAAKMWEVVSLLRPKSFVHLLEHDQVVLIERWSLDTRWSLRQVSLYLFEKLIAKVSMGTYIQWGKLVFEGTTPENTEKKVMVNKIVLPGSSIQ